METKKVVINMRDYIQEISDGFRKKLVDSGILASSKIIDFKKQKDKKVNCESGGIKCIDSGKDIMGRFER